MTLLRAYSKIFDSKIQISGFIFYRNNIVILYDDDVVDIPFIYHVIIEFI